VLGLRFEAGHHLTSTCFHGTIIHEDLTLREPDVEIEGSLSVEEQSGPSENSPVPKWRDS